MLTRRSRSSARCWEGELVTYRGHHFEVEGAKIWDLPEAPPPLGIAVSGARSCELAGKYADVMVAVEPNEELGQKFEDAGGAGKPRVGQVALCYDPDEGAARRRAHEQFRWFAGGWPVNAELSGTASFAAASQFVREDDVAEKIPCGPDVKRHIDAIQEFADAGFDQIALVQVGGEHQSRFIDWAAEELLPALRDQ